MHVVFIKGRNGVCFNLRHSTITLGEKGVLLAFLFCPYSGQVPTHTLNRDLFLII